MPPIIDAHQYFWNIQRFKYRWMNPAPTVLRRNYLPDDLRPHIARTGVERTIVIQAQPDLALEQTCWLLELADSEDFIEGVVGWIDPADPNVDQFLTLIETRPLLRGICHLAFNKKDADWQVREDVMRGLSIVAKHGLTYDFFLWPQIAHIPVLAKRLPELKIVINHLGKPPIKKGLMQGWLDGMKAAASFPNVYCKLSGMITEADWKNWKPQELRPYVEKVVELFSPKRLMFGSDWPFCLLAGSYERVYEALATTLDQLSESERENIFGNTARSFYGIDVSDSKTKPADHDVMSIKKSRDDNVTQFSDAKRRVVAIMVSNPGSFLACRAHRHDTDEVIWELIPSEEDARTWCSKAVELDPAVWASSSLSR